MDFTNSITWAEGGGGDLIQSEEKDELKWLKDLM